MNVLFINFWLSSFDFFFNFSDSPTEKKSNSDFKYGSTRA